MAWVGDLSIIVTSGGSELAKIADKRMCIELLDDIINARIKVDDCDFSGSSYRNSIVIRLGEYHHVAQIHNRKLWLKYLQTAYGIKGGLKERLLSFIAESRCSSAAELQERFPDLSLHQCAAYIGQAKRKGFLCVGS